MDSTRSAIVEEARSWIGTPWKHGQACKGIGCDCIGLVSGVARDLGFLSAQQFRADPRFRAYGKTPLESSLRAAIDEYLDRVDIEQAGDVLLMEHENVRYPHHFAIRSEVDGIPYMIHAWASAKKVVENRIDPTWRGRIVGVYKYREVA